MERSWKILVVVSVAVFMVSLDLFIVNIAFPAIGDDFSGATVSELSWVLNAYTIVFATLLVPAGRLADRVGRRRTFLVGVGIFLVGSALCGLAPSAPTLVAARVLQAVGAAAVMPTSLALLLPEFPLDKRSAAIGVWAAVGGVAAASGPPLGGVLSEVSWRLVFLVNLPVGAAALFYGMRLLRESRDEDARSWPDAIGSAQLMAAVALLSLGLVQAPEWGWGDARTVGALAAAPVLLALFLRRSARHPAPVVELSMLRVRSFAAANSAGLLFTAAFAAMLLASVLFVTEVWRQSVLTAGLWAAPGPAMAALFAVPSGRLANRIGHRFLAGAGSLIYAAGAAWWLWQLDGTPDYAAELLPGTMVTGMGVGMILPSLASAAASSLPPARFATGSAVYNMSRQLGSVLGVAILVAVLGQPAPQEALAAFDRAFAFIIAASGLGALVALSIGRVDVGDAALGPAPVGTATATAEVTRA